MNALVTIGVALAAWALSVILDRAEYLLHVGAAKTSNLAAWYWGALPLTILFAAVLLTSVWSIGFRTGAPRWVGLPLAMLALTLLAALPFVTTGLSPFETLLGRPLVRSELLLREAAPSSFFMIQTSAVLCSGLLALFRRSRT